MVGAEDSTELPLPPNVCIFAILKTQQLTIWTNTRLHLLLLKDPMDKRTRIELLKFSFQGLHGQRRTPRLCTFGPLLSPKLRLESSLVKPPFFFSLSILCSTYFLFLNWSICPLLFQATFTA